VGSSSPPPLPREHGAWTMLAIPMILGLRTLGLLMSFLGVRVL
jgi:hypothetical protein